MWKRFTFLAALLLVAFAVPSASHNSQESPWQMEFSVNRDELGATGRNDYFSLEPGYTLTLAHRNEQLVVSVLNETKRIDNVETRVVEERETRNGQLVEISRNYFAISSLTNDVYYFGEEVDIYKRGKVVGHEGAWRSGENGARFGLMMPGAPQIKMKFYQEICPGVAMDRAEIVSLTEKLKTPAGDFHDVLKIAETTPLERGTEFKYYARGVGLLQDGSLKLVKYGK